MAINNLFHKLTSVLQKRTGPASGVVPFAVGRIYQTAYRNWKHDPKPLLLILGSDAFYTVGINVHYLGAFQNSLIQFIIMLRNSQTVLTGKIIYELLKQRMPTVPKIAFRKYFTSMLRGRLVSEGISTAPEPNVQRFIAEPWVRRLNNMIKPRQFSFNKVSYNPDQLESLRNQAVSTRYNQDKSKPFANRRSSGHVVEYRPSGEEQ